MNVTFFSTRKRNYCNYTSQLTMESESRDQLLERIRALELENKHLRGHSDVSLESSEGADLSLDEYKRYGRQMIVPEFGALESQKKLKLTRALVVGAGGLGCPVLLYLSAAGIGEIGIVDDDTVDVSNLHRQVLHTTETVNMHKCESAKLYISRLNPHVKVTTYPVSLSNSNAFDIFENYDIVLDCTDAPAVRYLINDVAVILGKTVVSGSGLKTDGQWTILNFMNQGPCYRCFHPKPPSPDSVTSCQDGGVIGPAIGIIGVNMALETIKVLTGFYTKENFKPFLSAMYGYQPSPYRTFKMRGRQQSCAVCGNSPSVTREIIESNGIDYHVFCGRSEPYQLDNKDRITVQEYNQALASNTKSYLIDVRPTEQFNVVALPNSINIPWGGQFLKQELLDSLPANIKKDDEVFVVCRYGNDSQIATKFLKEKFGFTKVKDIKGGLNKWSDEIDKEFPKY